LNRWRPSDSKEDQAKRDLRWEQEIWHSHAAFVMTKRFADRRPYLERWEKKNGSRLRLAVEKLHKERRNGFSS